MPQPPQAPPPPPAAQIAAAGQSLLGRRILVVDASQTLPLALRGVSGATITLTRMATIDASLLARIRPDVVLSPLLTPEFDILDLARVLRMLGYRGALRAYCAPLPNATLVRAEVMQIWPGVDFDILEISAR